MADFKFDEDALVSSAVEIGVKAAKDNGFESAASLVAYKADGANIEDLAASGAVLAGAAIGTAVGGPIGAAVGSLAASAVVWAVDEIYEWAADDAQPSPSDTEQMQEAGIVTAPPGLDGLIAWFLCLFGDKAFPLIGVMTYSLKQWLFASTAHDSKTLVAGWSTWKKLGSLPQHGKNWAALHFLLGGTFHASDLDGIPQAGLQDAGNGFKRLAAPMRIFFMPQLDGDYASHRMMVFIPEGFPEWLRSDYRSWVVENVNPKFGGSPVVEFKSWMYGNHFADPGTGPGRMPQHWTNTVLANYGKVDPANSWFTNAVYFEGFEEVKMWAYTLTHYPNDGVGGITQGSIFNIGYPYASNPDAKRSQIAPAVGGLGIGDRGNTNFGGAMGQALLSYAGNVRAFPLWDWQAGKTVLNYAFSLMYRRRPWENLDPTFFPSMPEYQLLGSRLDAIDLCTHIRFTDDGQASGLVLRSGKFVRAYSAEELGITDDDGDGVPDVGESIAERKSNNDGALAGIALLAAGVLATGA